MDSVAPASDQPDWLRPSARLQTLRQLEVALSTAALVVAATAAARATPLLMLAAAVSLLGAGALGWGYVRRRYRSWGYLERQEDLLVRRGVMFQRLSVVPYGRMQTVEVTAGPLERSFGLATVQLHTASAATDARIPGLERLVAAQLRDRLVRLGEASAEGL
ncbi:MAG: PH domain-containing protein [Candidatus Dormiibacterota bacterium]